MDADELLFKNLTADSRRYQFSCPSGMLWPFWPKNFWLNMPFLFDRLPVLLGKDVYLRKFLNPLIGPAGIDKDPIHGVSLCRSRSGRDRRFGRGCPYILDQIHRFTHVTTRCHRCDNGGTIPKPRPKFGHGASVELDGGLTLIASYHPSQQNTFTGKLTREMFHAIFDRVRKVLQDR